MDQIGFMQEVERDAARRAQEREQRRLVAANMRKYSILPNKLVTFLFKSIIRQIIRFPD